MFKRLSIAVAVLTVVAMAVAPSASAQERERDGTFLAGEGVLRAHGNGLIALKGRMEFEGTADRAILLVKDIAGDAVVEVEGEGGTGEFHGFDVYFGTGAAHITGSEVAVIVLGEDIQVGVRGKGWAYLKGRGQYTVNGHGPFPWNPDGGFAGVAPDGD